MTRLAEDLDMPICTPMLGCNRQNTEYLAKNVMFHSCPNIDVWYNFMRQVLEADLIIFTKIKTQDNLADVLSKSLGKPEHKNHIGPARVTSIFNPDL